MKILVGFFIFAFSLSVNAAILSSEQRNYKVLTGEKKGSVILLVERKERRKQNGKGGGKKGELVKAQISWRKVKAFLEGKREEVPAGKTWHVLDSPGHGRG